MEDDWSKINDSSPANDANYVIESFDFGESHVDNESDSGDEYFMPMNKSEAKPSKLKEKKKKKNSTFLEIASLIKDMPVKVEPDQSLFVCELCGHTSKSKGVYDNHYEKNHMNNTYYCDLCGER